MKKEWTSSDEELLRSYFLNCGLEEMLEFFPHHDLEHILEKAIELDLL
jgi:hypothetical protein